MISYAAVSRSTKLLSNVGFIVECVHWPKQDWTSEGLRPDGRMVHCECSQN